MATLNDALQCLKPTSWEDVPQSPDELRDYVRDIFKQSRLIAESLPDPPPYDIVAQASEELHTGMRVTPSSVRVGETDPDVTALHKQWGKPIKMGGPKDNPLGLHVWKMAATDGGGHWFGRRSVHEGMPFSRWMEKMSSEYDETLKVNKEKIEKGETPDKSIRGIGAEEKVENVEVLDEDGLVMGHLTVYHVSAQFPKPTAPRDFISMNITSERGMEIGGSKQSGRSWIMISKPCEHPNVPPKDGYVRGEYESVEMIREIPRTDCDRSSPGSERVEMGGTGRQCPDAVAGANGAMEDKVEELNPVEWIMVTRSDPGGSIPRWMVDKGTPKSVGADAAKFVNWAILDDEFEMQKEEAPLGAGKAMQSAQIQDDDGLDHDEEKSSGSDSDYDSSDIDAQSHHGLIASVAGLLNSSLERYAPQAIRDYIPYQHQAPHSIPEDSQAPKGGVDGTKTSDSKTNAEYFTTREPDHASLSSARSALATPAVEDVAPANLSPEELMAMTKAGKLTSHEKDLAKLALRKREIDARLETIRSELEKLQLPSDASPASLKGSNEAESEKGRTRKRAGTNHTDRTNHSSTPASSGTQQSPRVGDGSDGQSLSNTATPSAERPAHVQKAATQLLHEEAKLMKQLRKIEGNQLKTASKIQAHQRKAAERSEKNKSKSEVEHLRSEVKDLKKELSKMRAERQTWVDLVTSLQAENTKLAAARDESA